MSNHIKQNITITLEPDLSRIVTPRKRHENLLTGEWIPKGMTCANVAFRYDGKLFRGYVTLSEHERLLEKIQ